MSKISLLVSDVDGTLVTSDKRLTEASRRAVRRLSEHGIAFTITSSRPPIGLRMLVAPLGLQLPMVAFNGAAIVRPDLEPIEERFIPPEAARQAIEVLSSFGVGIWVFPAGCWLVTDPVGDYVERERRTIQAEPDVVTTFGPYLSRAAKIVGVSSDHDRLEECEAAAQAALGASASIARSQLYYLDITPPDVDKGTAVDSLSRQLQIPLENIATVGDMENDLPMFRRGGFSIAMGNATEQVKRQAQAVTLSNDEDGFAAAVERFILQRDS